MPGAATNRATGIGLRLEHLDELAAAPFTAAWYEAHPENFLANAYALERLLRVRRDRPVALHSVGLCVGDAGGVDRTHLRRVAELAQTLEPRLVSVHLAWCGNGGVFLNDLLPIPYDDESLAVVAANVGVVQAALGRAVLVENPSAYLRFDGPLAEPHFLAELVRRTGCLLLCDVNNAHVSAVNHGGDAAAWLAALPADAVAEVHLAGHEGEADELGPMLIDTHGAPVDPAVWSLFAHAVQRFPNAPAMVEWDSRLPDLARLQDEAAAADRVAQATLKVAA